uniref:Uncharacterized protein n=1 Tax=Cacopsylla melanoneura TaxID=428564 RepID=A0A8D8XZZ7_9HEMI
MTKLKLLEARRAHLFAECQECYESIAKYQVDKTKKNAFLTQAVIVEGNYADYKALVSEIEEFKMNEKADYEPNFQSLKSYSDMLGCIRLSYQRLEGSSSKDADTVVPEPPKLPNIELTTFDGCLKNWPIFHETFKAIIHTNSRLTDEQRVQYLISKLSGSALMNYPQRHTPAEMTVNTSTAPNARTSASPSSVNISMCTSSPTPEPATTVLLSTAKVAVSNAHGNIYGRCSCQSSSTQRIGNSSVSFGVNHKINQFSASRWSRLCLEVNRHLSSLNVYSHSWPWTLKMSSLKLLCKWSNSTWTTI